MEYLGPASGQIKMDNTELKVYVIPKKMVPYLDFLRMSDGQGLWESKIKDLEKYSWNKYLLKVEIKGYYPFMQVEFNQNLEKLMNPKKGDMIFNGYQPYDFDGKKWVLRIDK